MRVKNWQKFQHFKDRKPPWIKLYRDILDDIQWHKLDGDSCKALVMIWLIASEQDGELPAVEELAFRLRVSGPQAHQSINSLIEAGFIVDGVAAQAEPGAMTARDIARKNGFGSRHISDAIKRVVWERDGGICQECESTANIEYDHKHPVSKGGNSEVENIQLLCRPCNRRKRAKLAEQSEPDENSGLGMHSLETETETETESEKEGERARAPKPTLENFELDEELRLLCKPLDPVLEIEKFKDHHRAKGSRLRDIRAAFRNWIRKGKQFANLPDKPTQSISADADKIAHDMAWTVKMKLRGPGCPTSLQVADLVKRGLIEIQQAADYCMETVEKFCEKNGLDAKLVTRETKAA